MEEYAERAPHDQVVIAREVREFEGVRCGTRVLTTHQFEQGRVHSSKRERADMAEVRHSPLHAVDERNRAIDLTERPQGQREKCHSADAGVLSETECHVVVATWLKQSERAFQMLPRLEIVRGEVQGDALSPMRHAGLGRIGPGLDVGEESRGVRLHRRQFATGVAAGP